MIEAIYEELKAIGAVKSSNDFSRQWLGMEQSYLRCLRSKSRQPSAKALANCASRLKRTVAVLAANDRNTAGILCQRLSRLADGCVDTILATPWEVRNAHE
jgi:hypothetical protein